MKRIAFLLVYFPAKFQTFVINQILNAHNAGYDIRIFPQYLSKPEGVSQAELIECHNLMNKVIKPIPFELNKLKRIKWLLNNLYRGPRELTFYFVKSLNPFLFGKNGVNLVVFRHLLQFHGNSDFDIFHCQYGPAGLIAAWLKELGLLNGKIITTFHGYDAHFNDDYLRQFYRARIRTWSPLLFKHSAMVTVCTPFLFNQVVDLGADPNKVELLPLGIDTSFFIPNGNLPKKENVQLLSVGRLVKWKGHDLASAISFFPIKKWPIQLVVGMNDILHDRRSFIFAGSLSISLFQPAGKSCWKKRGWRGPPPAQASRI